MLFQDCTDVSRFVEVVPGAVVGKKQTIKVFWEKEGYLCYGGMTQVPTKLFEKAAQIRQIGFHPVPE